MKLPYCFCFDCTYCYASYQSYLSSNIYLSNIVCVAREWYIGWESKKILWKWNVLWCTHFHLVKHIWHSQLELLCQLKTVWQHDHVKVHPVVSTMFINSNGLNKQFILLLKIFWAFLCSPGFYIDSGFCAIKSWQFLQ
jgi:hypothetical protein